MKTIYKIVLYLIAAVWISNGLLCKVLNLVPRHEQIIAEILGHDFSRPLTILIGISEIFMAIWILSRIKTKLNVFAQIVIVITMNTMEFILVPDLLLWGKLNSFFALCFVITVFVNYNYFSKKIEI
jgi:hypothetical protein